MRSDGDGVDLLAYFQRRKASNTPRARQEASISPGMFFSEESSADERHSNTNRSSKPHTRTLVAVRVKPVKNRHEFIYYEPKEAVGQILREFNRKGEITYMVRLTTGETKELSFDDLLTTEDGPKALETFHEDDDSEASTATAGNNMHLRSKPKKTREQGMVDIADFIFSSDELASSSRKPRQSRLRVLSKRETDSSRSSRTRTRPNAWTSDEEEDNDSDERPKRRGRKPKAQPAGPPRRSGRVGGTPQVYEEEEEEEEEEDEEDSDSEMDILCSDIFQGRKRKRGSRGHTKGPEKNQRQSVRQSDRSTRARNNMEEANINDIYRSGSEPRKAAGPKIVSIKEIFEPIPRSNLFRSRHVEGCETCGEGPNIATLVYCQGCSLAYHKNCLGNRAAREHLVTKISEENFVLQCKRCINIYQKKDSTAPNLAMCQDCGQDGASCKPFRSRKSPLQEQKDRDDNAGQDPVTNVSPKLINNARNVLFRCTKCSCAYHFHHLPPLSPYAMDTQRSEEETADERFQEYSKNWLCKDCEDAKGKKVSTLIAWRPSDAEAYRPGTSCDMLKEDEKQYLIKWEEQSYFRASWHSGAWTWGVVAPAMRKAFFKRETGPKMRTEDAIPEEYLRIDIVLNIKYTSHVSVRNEDIDKARVKEVDKALIKYKGLGYEDAVWENVPSPDDGDRWLDFVTAYNDWVAGRYLKYPKQGPLKNRLEKARGTAFAKLEMEKQPSNLVGGELMKYQVEGLNWIYYQWYSQRNGILADEMGLGKTIQVIAFIATLVAEHNCFPFLVVVPNSTCANWRREIKQWIPSLRVVTFFGSSTARDMAYRYEMYPEGTKELRAHVVVTSYEAASDDSCRQFFRNVNWAGLIVDEGQRLKNDKSQLYGALNAVKAPFRLLLTGTPLQNNARELFNLLQFLDDTIKASKLEEKYPEITSENIKELHEQIRPFILRRTKAQVLTFLPSLGQVIVPLSMSHLQRNLYKSILAKNPELLKALFTTTKALKQQELANLSNILMQLRKCLCHPFVYSREIEERTDVAAVSHRNLVEASAKLQLLELLLPKLQERGHRVLIFSQFLDMLSIIEDFLDGLQLAYQRLDGTMGSLEKQKRIDQFNAPDSPLFAFLLSTRAGGVGINLATADTVIILDPDFNPHQDIQAISRAHRIGQKKKVLCFQLMTRASAEEKITQMGRKKMALDHVVVEQLDAEDIEEKDVESILKHGAAELFKDDDGEHDIRYDDASIDKLLDRSQIENTRTDGDDSAESQFSFARVWANDQCTLHDTLNAPEEEAPPDPGVWDRILQERAAKAAREAVARADALGRGKRTRMAVDYNQREQDATIENDVVIESSPVKNKHRKKKNKLGSESDTDFQAGNSEEEEEESATEDQVDASEEAKNLKEQDQRRGTSKIAGAGVFKPSNLPSQSPSVTLPKPPQSTQTAGVRRETVDHHAVPSKFSSPSTSRVQPFVRAELPVRTPLEPNFGQWGDKLCPICPSVHPRGACPLKIAGAEHCGLCGLAHFGHGRTCPHIKSETQVRYMLEALKNSPEKRELVDAAVKYLRGVKGTLVRAKKKDREKAMMSNASLNTQMGVQGHPPKPPNVMDSSAQRSQPQQGQPRPPYTGHATPAAAPI
ncbi:chromodomain-helicase-DNA-binding protein 4 [Polyplosphaeria fusca]|uniref:Chromodomain-helicase-DNA-binding protein 4 n=1 Tax=Polyplosphaeria fusca TaxID=682080 RepID=A0A9P4RAB7_9PLEO|nr:chromodomain-helicase-DNA-binding protein 4 [Polyplosphaeria fusca]